jgi:hypothetical protein
MPPDSPEKRLGLPRSQVVEIIERGQAEAIRNLRLAGVPEQQILAAVRQLESACLTALQEQRAFYTDLKAIARQAESDPDIAQLVRERGAMYQHLVDTAVAEIVRIVIQNTINEFQNPPARKEPVIAVTPYKPGFRDWLGDALHTTTSLFLKLTWLSGLVAGLMLSWFGGGSSFLSVFWIGVTVVVTAILWDWIGGHLWSIVFPLTALGVFCIAIF